MTLKLGKRPHTEDKRDLQLGRYLTTDLPPAPDRFGFDQFVPKTGWGMLGNDEYGCCVWSGAAHEHMVLTGGNHRAAQMARFTTVDVLTDYADATGFRPDDPSTDQGTNVREALGYRRSKGIVDATGARHKISVYVSLPAGDWDMLMQATYLFEAVGIGIEFPASAMAQFDNGLPWDVVAHSRIEGGHYVPVVGRWSADRCACVTWGRLQTVTRDFIEAYCDEAWAFVAPDDLTATGSSLRGLDMTRLEQDLAAINNPATKAKRKDAA